MSHLEENSSFDEEYRNMLHWSSTASLRKPFTKADLRRHGPGQWECSMSQSRKNKNKTGTQLYRRESETLVGGGHVELRSPALLPVLALELRSPRC